MRAVLILPDGDAQVLQVEPDLGSLQAMVGGYIEAVPVPGVTAHAYVNEDGRRLRMPPNFVATLLLGQEIVGPAVVFGTQDAPDEGDVPDEVLVRLGLE